MVLGIIDNVNTSNDMGNLLTAYGVTELKRTIEKMSNNQERAYLGIHGADVPEEAIRESGMPTGTYVKEIEMDSPAMNAGIQSGDVIIAANGTPIENYKDLLNVLNIGKPEDTMDVTLVRQGQEVGVQVTLGRR